MRSTLLRSAAHPLPVVALLSLTLAGCSGDENTPPTEPTLTAIEVAPATATVQVGGSTAFTATGRLSDNTTTAVTVTWSATGGSITSTGNYTAGNTAGTYQVTAAAGSLSGKAAVTITASRHRVIARWSSSPSPALSPTPSS